MAWFERELSWGVPATELRHLCGRIGELYVALITNGQMATAVNQRGYDVVGRDGERISVKTTATESGSGQAMFRTSSLELVDRVIVLRINTEEMQIETILNVPIGEARAMMSEESDGKRSLYLGRIGKVQKSRGAITTVREVRIRDYTVRELETGTIEVEREGAIILPAKPALRDIASVLNINLVNAAGTPLTTRQLGTQIIKSVQALNESTESIDERPSA